MKYFKFDVKLFLILSFSFIIMTVLGTLSHELGHYTVAKYFGYDARIDYQSMRIDRNPKRDYLNVTYQKYMHAYEQNLDFPEKDQYNKIRLEYRKENMWILLGGPLQTMLTGSIGFILLLIYRRKLFSEYKTSFTGWILLFISLFWLRQSANLVMWILDYMITGEKSLKADEFRIARYLNFDLWTIFCTTGVIGLAILYGVIRLLPKNQVLTFLTAGLVGGISGYYLWLVQFGKYILP